MEHQCSYSLICLTLGCNIQAAFQTSENLSCHKLHQKYINLFKNNGSDNTADELDEYETDENKHPCGKPVRGARCFRMVERTIGRKILWFPINQRHKVTLIPLITRCIIEQLVL